MINKDKLSSVRRAFANLNIPHWSDILEQVAKMNGQHILIVGGLALEVPGLATRFVKAFDLWKEIHEKTRQLIAILTESHELIQREIAKAEDGSPENNDPPIFPTNDKTPKN